MKKIITILTLCLTILSIYGCKDSNEENVSYNNKTLNIWFVASSSTDASWLAFKGAFEDECDKLGVDGTFVGPEYDDDVLAMIDLCQEAIDDKADVLICDWADYDSFNEVAQNALDAGVKLLGFDHGLPNGLCDYYLGFDPSVAGTVMAEALVENRGTEYLNVLYLDSTDDSSLQILMQQAFAEKLAELAPEAIVNYVYTYGDAEVANQLIEDNMLVNGHTEIVCACPVASVVAGDYKLKYEISDEALFVQGYSGSADILSYVKQGVLSCTVVQDWTEAGRSAVSLAQQFANGEELAVFTGVGIYYLSNDGVDAYALDNGIELN